MGLGTFFWPGVPLSLVGPPLVVACLLVSFLAFQTAPRSFAGFRARRRLREGSLGFLIALLVASQVWSLPWLTWVSFPLFLLWVYGGYPAEDLGLLWMVQTFLVVLSAWRFDQMNWVSCAAVSFLLGIWVLLAVTFRSQELRKRRRVTDRLDLYEREAKHLAVGAQDIQSALRGDERKKAHLASMIREREDTFQNLVQVLFKTFDAYSVMLYLYDSLEEKFVEKERLSHSKLLNEFRIQPLEGIFKLLAKAHAPIRVSSRTGYVRGITYYRSGEGVQAAIAIPLRCDGMLEGAVIIDRKEGIPFLDAELDVATQIAGQLARAIENAEVLHAHFQLREELENFYEAASALNRSLRVDDVVQTLLNSAQNISHFDWGLVVLHGQGARTNRIVAEYGSEGKMWVGRTFALAPDRGVVSWVIANQMPLYYTDFHERYDKTILFHKQLKVPNQYSSVLILPLQHKGEAVGALLLTSKQNHFFSKSVRSMLEVVGIQASSSLKNARMVSKLEELATTDGLTGLVNHRTFQERLAEELIRTDRHPASLSLLLLDIDFFKKFNDEYGHPVGDFVLKEIASFLRRMVRKVDTVARYGGEEFAIVLVNTPTKGAKQMADRIVNEVARSRFQHQGLTLRVSVSIGVATYPDHATLREDLIERADRALYESKEQGRNQATLYDRKFGKMESKEREERLIDQAEDQLRKMEQTELALS